VKNKIIVQILDFQWITNKKHRVLILNFAHNIFNINDTEVLINIRRV
jgi:hypothetical protein